VDTLDVQIRTQIRPVVTGDHLLRLKVYTPRGYLYQTFTVPFRFATSDQDQQDQKAVRREPTRVVPGYPRPLEVQVLGDTRSAVSRRTTAVDQATARLPVAGTSISLGSLFGQWTVVPYLDDGTAPCGPPRTFEIRE
jgi:hypothetical protein